MLQKKPRALVQSRHLRHFNTNTWAGIVGDRLMYMYANRVLSAAFRAVPGVTTRNSCPSSTTTRNVSVSQGPSSDVYVVACKLLHCWHTNHALHIKFFLYYLHKTNYFYCAQTRTRARDSAARSKTYRHTPSTKNTRH
jgi:hypothetical protein